MKHSGCFVCGGGKDEILTSIPDMISMTSIAICKRCFGMGNEELRTRIDKIRNAMLTARQEAANG